MTTTSPIRTTSLLLDSKPDPIIERSEVVARSEARTQVLRLPARANLAFRLSSLLIAGAVVLAARIAAALFARR